MPDANPSFPSDVDRSVVAVPGMSVQARIDPYWWRLEIVNNRPIYEWFDSLDGSTATPLLQNETSSIIDSMIDDIDGLGPIINIIARLVWTKYQLEIYRWTFALGSRTTVETARTSTSAHDPIIRTEQNG